MWKLWKVQAEAQFAEHRRGPDDWRLVHRMLYGTPSNRPFAGLGRRLILWGWRLSASANGSVVVKSDVGGRDLWVVEIPCC
jgi:hypothetical protein